MAEAKGHFLSREQENRAYISEKVNPLIENMLMDLLKEKPLNSLEFMIKWLQNEGRKIYNEFIHPKQISTSATKKNPYDENSEDSDENDIEEIQKSHSKSVQKNGRTSVSAEVYGIYNKKSDYQPKKIKKSFEQIGRIKERIKQSFLFSELDPKDFETVLNAFEEKTFTKGSAVIKQGEDGDNLYVVDSGELDCFKIFSKDSENTHLKIYVSGEAFGELSLLYNAPRAATIIAKTDCILFALDRECFNHIVKESAMKKRQKYEEFLSKIEILDSVDPYERSKIADALKPFRFKKGELVVKEGEKGDVFFFLEEGECVAKKVLIHGQEPETVLKYKKGDYFGELALLKDRPRAASVVAETDVSLVGLDRQSFKRLLGPLEEILKRNFARYEKYVI